jgi:hypothetical protein
VIATLIAVILSLLGLSYLMMAQTENTIAENERNAAMALYVAEAGARIAINWFNDPSSTGYLVPTTAQVDRSKRLLDEDNNPATVRVVAASADATKPLYKDAAFTPSGILDRPYRSALADTFLGIQTGTDPDPTHATRGPDLIVNDSHLATINDALFPNFPAASLRARIARIEIYAPPTVNAGGVPTRMGIATVRAVGGVFLYPGTAQERQIATRVVKAVINEIPVPGPVGPLQSCSQLNYNGEFEVNWGTGSAIGNADLPGNLAKLDTGLPYANNDPFTYYSDPLAVPPRHLKAWAEAHDGDDIDDPWLRFIAGGTIDTASPSTEPQPWKFTDTAWPGSLDDHSNMFQGIVINCPTFDYSMWKSIAQSGNRNHFYYKYVGGGNFSLDGTGPATTVRAATDARGGIHFFDTTDSQHWRPPSDPSPNQTPLIDESGGTWSMQGFIFLNALNFRTTGLGGINRTIIPPGEPGDGSGFVNFIYPGALAAPFEINDGAAQLQSFLDPVTGDWWCTDAQQCDAGARTQAAAPVKDSYGLPFQAPVLLDGVFYTSGSFEAQGNADYFGSLVAQGGVIDGGGNPGFYFDESLVKGNWPRKGMALPRVIISVWETDL